VTRRLAILAVCLAALALMLPMASASASQLAFPGVDCKESPTPDMPGQGLAGFFEKTPQPVPDQADPFAEGARTTMYEQYGYSGLRWHTYDLGCGPDAARNPDAVIGTALSNWILNVPIAWSALTSSITEVAFEPRFLTMFDPMIARVSGALHRSLFATWVPAVIALLGMTILLTARRSALATTAASVGWALMVVLLATAIFRWPLAAGHFADETVTSILGSVVGGINGGSTDVTPSKTIGSNVQESIFYSSWLAGTLGSTDSPTAKKYGGQLFKAQALTWHEAYVVQRDPEAGKRIIEAKKDAFQTIASQIESRDPAAYEHLTGRRSDTRVGYAILSTLAAFLALPFLFVSALLLLGSFLIVRLAVMLFPAFATLGVFPAGRGLVIGIGRTVGAAFVNAVIFGIGAAVTIRVLGLILDPESGLPGWLALVLMPLFGFVMWVALKPFRRLTAMVSPSSDPFGDAAGALGDASRRSGRWVKRTGTAAAAAYTGNVAAAATVAAGDDGPPDDLPAPDRVEARPTVADAHTSTGEPRTAFAATQLPAAPNAAPMGSRGTPASGPSSGAGGTDRGCDAGFDPRGTVTSESAPLVPVEPEWVDGEEVFTVYRPGADDAHDAA
jgi:uncharacterized membrane protein